MLHGLVILGVLGGLLVLELIIVFLLYIFCPPFERFYNKLIRGER
jgi:hypothetical protein